MTIKIYSVLDIIAEEFGPLFQAKNDGVALRSYDKLFTTDQNRSEFELHCLGEWDTEQGEITTTETYIVLSQDKTSTSLEDAKKKEELIHE